MNINQQQVQMALAVLLFLSLFLSLVYCQTFPYVSFRGKTLANHSCVNLSQVGDLNWVVKVQCITDLTTCCSGAQGPYRGDWYFPTYGDIYESRGSQRVDLRRNTNANSPTAGIYRCDIPTNAVHDDTDRSVRDTVYVGLYTASGGNAN